MFMDINIFTFSLLILFSRPNTVQGGSSLVLINTIMFPLQNKINIEVRIGASKTLTEKRFYFRLVNPLHFCILLYPLREYTLKILTVLEVIVTQ